MINALVVIPARTVKVAATVNPALIVTDAVIVIVVRNVKIVPAATNV